MLLLTLITVSLYHCITVTLYQYYYFIFCVIIRCENMYIHTEDKVISIVRASAVTLNVMLKIYA